MSWTKRQFISAALDEIGIGSYAFDIQPEQYESALKKLDAMMASWNAYGIRLSYPIPSNPEDSYIDDRSNVPDSANEAIALNLAVRLAPGYGKAVSRETKVAARVAYNGLLAQTKTVKEINIMNGMPKGSGNKSSIGYNNSPYFSPNPDILNTGNDGELEFE